MRASSIAYTALLVTVGLLPTSEVRAQPADAPKRVLVLKWDNREHPANQNYDQPFRAALRASAPGDIECYFEYLDTTNFPGEGQSLLLRDYLRQKYADHKIDVLVTTTSPALNFLLQQRAVLFPQTPIVFANERPVPTKVASKASATGIVYDNTYRKTVELALALHPGAKHLFVISGTLETIEGFESVARAALKGYENELAITYLTDLSLKDLKTRLERLPDRSIVLYIWQQVRDSRGNLLETSDVLAMIAQWSKAPIYGMSPVTVGLGVVGGYVWTNESRDEKLAELTRRVANGTRAVDIPIENAPALPMFDWRQLQRWRIPEERLPPGSIIRFRKPTMWQQFKWRIIAAVAAFTLQLLLIGALLVERRRAHARAAALVRAQRVLRESEERFRNMANTASVMIVVAGPDGQATFFNNGWLNFTGRTMEQELGSGWVEGVHPEDAHACLAEMSASYAKRSQCHVEYRLRRSDGEYRFVMCSGIPRFEADGAFAGYIASLVDITDVKRSHEQALASQKLESLGVLAAGIAHDFNNLLSGIMASSELQIHDLAEASPARETLERISSIASRGTEIVRELMIYAHQESPTFEEVDLGELVREMLQLLTVSISKSVALKIDLPGTVPLIHANPAQIRQVVMNLIINASDALEEQNGAISLTLRQVETPDTGIDSCGRTPSTGSWLRLEVRDSGCGMTDEILARIFDPFFTTKGMGRGLGLAAVRGIVDSHGGTIRVASRPGEGTKFEILLPCVSLAQVETHDTVPSSCSLTKNEALVRSILMVDDETHRRPMAQLLRGTGFSVMEASDSATGVEIFREQTSRIQAVLLELTLPGMPEVLVELRRARPNIPVILTSTYRREQMLTDEQSDVFYLQKPFGLGRLLEILHNISQGPAEMKRARAG
jgi:PAS domain S-box-containing protein